MEKKPVLEIPISSDSPKNILPQKPRLSRRLVFIIVGVILVLWISITLLFNKSSESIVQPFPINESQLTVVVSPTPTPDPFVELTIPYLRQREYQSSLTLNYQVAETESYTSFFATYDSDGLAINGLLTRPKGDPPLGGWPAIVFIHGYIPPQQYRTTENYNSYVDYLAKNGLVVFKIDLRGHDQSEGEPSGGYYSGDYVIDALNARAALQASDFVNSQKIGLWGHSMAGNIVFRAFVATQDIPAIVIWAGAVYTYSDFSDYSIEDNSYQPPRPDSSQAKKRELLWELHGNFVANDPFWQQVPGTNYLDGVRGAVQMNHAVDDGVVSIEYSRNLMRILNSTQITHELKEYSSGGHNITGAAFTQAMQNTVEFFKMNLK